MFHIMVLFSFGVIHFDSLAHNDKYVDVDHILQVDIWIWDCSVNVDLIA